MELDLAKVRSFIRIGQGFHTELTEGKGGGASRCDDVLGSCGWENGGGACGK